MPKVEDDVSWSVCCVDVTQDGSTAKQEFPLHQQVHQQQRWSLMVNTNSKIVYSVTPSYAAYFYPVKTKSLEFQLSCIDWSPWNPAGI